MVELRSIRVELQPTGLSFGQLRVSSISPFQTVVIRNLSDENLVFTKLTLSDMESMEKETPFADDFKIDKAIQKGDCLEFAINQQKDFELKSNSSCTVRLSFQPIRAGSRSALFTVMRKDDGVVYSATLEGSAD